ncbi:lonely Cys domain-containing protein [Streptomyces sp900105755]|uniref:lonely Cys domain-containing protein n=1 Tax=Streptomyces sp. 900105755 TaxID=3154389 RepID=UPI0033174DC9
MAQKTTLGLSTLKDTIVRATTAGARASASNELNTTRNHTTTTTATARTATASRTTTTPGRTTTTTGPAHDGWPGASAGEDEEATDNLLQMRPHTVADSDHTTTPHHILPTDTTPDTTPDSASDDAWPGASLQTHPVTLTQQELNAILHRTPTTTTTPDTTRTTSETTTTDTTGAPGRRTTTGPHSPTGSGTADTPAAAPDTAGTRPGTGDHAAAPATTGHTLPRPDTRTTSDNHTTHNGALPGFETHHRAPNTKTGPGSGFEPGPKTPQAGPLPPRGTPSDADRVLRDTLIATDTFSRLDNWHRSQSSAPDKNALARVMQAAADKAGHTHGDRVKNAILDVAHHIGRHGLTYNKTLAQALVTVADALEETLEDQTNTIRLAQTTTDFILTGDRGRIRGGTSNQTVPYPDHGAAGPSTTRDGTRVQSTASAATGFDPSPLGNAWDTTSPRSASAHSSAPAEEDMPTVNVSDGTPPKIGAGDSHDVSVTISEVMARGDLKQLAEAQRLTQIPNDDSGIYLKSKLAPSPRTAATPQAAPDSSQPVRSTHDLPSLSRDPFVAISIRSGLRNWLAHQSFGFDHTLLGMTMKRAASKAGLIHSEELERAITTAATRVEDQGLKSNEELDRDLAKVASLVKKHFGGQDNATRLAKTTTDVLLTGTRGRLFGGTTQSRNAGSRDGSAATSSRSTAARRYDTILNEMSTALYHGAASRQEAYGQWVDALSGLEGLWDDRRGEFDPYGLAERVMLFPGAQYSKHHLLLALLEHYADAQSNGEVNSITELIARHIGMKLEALSEDFTLTGSADNDRIRDWGPTSNVGALTEVDLEWVAFANPNGSRIGPEFAAPWITESRNGSPTYAVRAELVDDGLVSVRTAQGAAVNVNEWVFAELLKFDLDRLPGSQNSPIVLAFSGAGSEGLNLPRVVSFVTGRQTWAPSGNILIVENPFPMFALTDHHSYHTTRGAWIESSPSDLLEPDSDSLLMLGGFVQAIGGDVVSDNEIHTHTVVGGRTGEIIGRMSYEASGDFAGMSEIGLGEFRNVNLKRSWFTDSDAKITTRDPQVLPWQGRNPYLFAAHGLPGVTTLQMRNGSTIGVGGTELGRYLKRRPSFARHESLVLNVCFAGASVSEESLDDAPLAQYVANATGYVVFAPTVKVHTYASGAIALDDNHAGEQAPKWETFWPEPEEAQLHDLAVSSGLHTGDGPVEDMIRTQTLHGVRSLRQLFGPGIERARDYLELLRGVTAIEGAWLSAHRPSDGKFSILQLENIIDGYGRTTYPTHADRAEPRRNALQAAARTLAGNPGEQRPAKSPVNAQQVIWTRLIIGTNQPPPVRRRQLNEIFTAVSQSGALPAQSLGAPQGPRRTSAQASIPSQRQRHRSGSRPGRLLGGELPYGLTDPATSAPRVHYIAPDGRLAGLPTDLTGNNTESRGTSSAGTTAGRTAPGKNPSLTASRRPVTQDRTGGESGRRTVPEHQAHPTTASSLPYSNNHEKAPSIITEYTVTHRVPGINGAAFMRVNPVAASGRTGDRETFLKSTAFDWKELITVKQEVVGEEHPPLLVSEDGTLAMSSSREVREVFTTLRCMENAEAQLRAAGSKVRLAQDTSVELTFTHKGMTRTLYPVRPDFDPPTDVCRDVAGHLIGGMPDHIVFRSPGKVTAVSPMSGAGSVQVPEMHQLANALVNWTDGSIAQQEVTTSWVTEEIAGAPAPKDRLSDAKYGHYSSADPEYAAQRFRIAAATARIGVNDHAWAHVGEAYLTQSVRSYDESGELSPVHYVRENSLAETAFGYHYAAVVLASEDGSAQATLENYSRKGATQRAAEAAVEQNLINFGDRLELMRASVQRDASLAPARQASLSRTFDALIRLREAVQQREASAPPTAPGEFHRQDDLQVRNSVEEARKSAAMNILRESNAQGFQPAKNLWFMRFVSKGHTFHDHMVDPAGRMINPLTAVVVGKHKEPMAIYREINFSERAKDLGSSQEAAGNLGLLAQHAARVGIWNFRNGLPVPKIFVSAGGNGSFVNGERGAQRAAQQRIGFLEQEFRKILQGSLDKLQEKVATADRLAAEQFVIVGINRKRHLPEGAATPTAEEGKAFRRQGIIRMEVHPAAGI